MLEGLVLREIRAFPVCEKILPFVSGTVMVGFGSSMILHDMKVSIDFVTPFVVYWTDILKSGLVASTGSILPDS